MPEIARWMKEFDSRSAFVFNRLDVDDATILMLLRVAMNQAQDLAGRNGEIENDKTSMGAHALHLRGFAEKFGVAVESKNVHRNNKAEALASALCARRARCSWRIHREDNSRGDDFATMVQKLEMSGTTVFFRARTAVFDFSRALRWLTHPASGLPISNEIPVRVS